MLNIFKLISGEEIFCSVRNEDENGWYIEDPVTYAFTPGSGIMMKHWMNLCNDSYVFISKDKVLADLGEPNALGYYYYDIYLAEAKRNVKHSLRALEETPVADATEELKLMKRDRNFRLN